jgi:phosphatidylserine/phosphatidylglycerophosphate/cardiolipin synthase-like enzyme
MDQHRVIIESATVLATGLPRDTVESVAEAVETAEMFALRAEISRRVANHQQRDRALAFIDAWKRDAAGVSATVVAVALRTAAISEQKHRDAQTVELVWTGPEVEQIPFRRTEQAILQLLDTAQKRITLVSFAVYNIPNIATALVKAARRGVSITVIVETPDKLGGENEYSTLRALGAEVANCSRVYFWPKEHRRMTEANKPGLLHVKCAVADGEWLFLSSANLTQQAFTVNMELGVLVRGGTMPGRVEEQFRRLIQSGVLEPV